MGLLFVNAGFYSRSAPGWKLGGGGTSHAQPWSSSSTSQCWARVSGRDAEWATVPGKCPHQVGRRDLAGHLHRGSGGSETPSVCHTAAWGRELEVGSAVSDTRLSVQAPLSTVPTTGPGCMIFLPGDGGTRLHPSPGLGYLSVKWGGHRHLQPSQGWLREKPRVKASGIGRMLNK